MITPVKNRLSKELQKIVAIRGKSGSGIKRSFTQFYLINIFPQDAFNFTIEELFVTLRQGSAIIVFYFINDRLVMFGIDGGDV